jgi:uncharacterized membrane protein
VNSITEVWRRYLSPRAASLRFTIVRETRQRIMARSAGASLREAPKTDTGEVSHNSTSVRSMQSVARCSSAIAFVAFNAFIPPAYLLAARG